MEKIHDMQERAAGNGSEPDLTAIKPQAELEEENQRLRDELEEARQNITTLAQRVQVAEQRELRKGREVDELRDHFTTLARARNEEQHGQSASRLGE